MKKYVSKKFFSHNINWRRVGITILCAVIIIGIAVFTIELMAQKGLLTR